MGTDSIEIEGKNYVSSNRAAAIVGYTKDYVGQLARAGKIDAKRIGRTWYVHDASIQKHKLETHYTLTKQKTISSKQNGEKPTVHIAFSGVYNPRNISSKRKEPHLFPKVPAKKISGAEREMARANISFEPERSSDISSKQTDTSRVVDHVAPKEDADSHVVPISRHVLRANGAPKQRESAILRPQAIVSPKIIQRDSVGVESVAHNNAPLHTTEVHKRHTVQHTNLQERRHVRVRRMRKARSKIVPVVVAIVISIFLGILFLVTR